MKKFHVYEFDIHLLKLFLSSMNHDETIDFVKASFSKRDLIESVLHIYKQANETTNTKMERFYKLKVKEREQNETN